jgi:hypothetical protein
MEHSLATAGSQRWLQIAIARTPQLLDESLRTAGAIDKTDSVDWKSSLAIREVR